MTRAAKDKNCYRLKNFYNRLTRFLWKEMSNFLLYRFVLFFRTIKNSIQWIFFSPKNKKDRTLNCPVRGVLTTQVYDSVGNFTEEYYRVEIIKQLVKKGFPGSHMNFHHKIQVGHGGKNSFIPDLIIKNRSEKGYFLVLEVKKNSDKMKEALLYQLNPAISILNSQYGIYYDGTRKSSCFRRDGSRVQNFNFLDIPAWFYSEWKRS